jgi:signal transduction histidine kinase
MSAANDANQNLLHNLGERVKELTALHRTARLLQDDLRPTSELMRDVVALLPDAWQFPETTGARIRFQSLSTSTPNFLETHWLQVSSFTVRGGSAGEITVCYLVEKPEAAEGPFLAEERDLIDSLAEMLKSYFQHKLADEDLQRAHDNLEQQVRERTAQLQKTNAALQEQVSEYRKAEQRIDSYQKQLRKLASELSLTEARERRAIASDLHDHIGQALAFIKMRISQFQGDAIFCGFEETIGEIMTLLEQTIRSTRDLTFEISPPVLYELGLEAAIGWLAEEFQKKHGIKVKVVVRNSINPLNDELQVMLFKSVQELLTNVAKHAGARKVVVTLDRHENQIRITVEDDGRGFDPDQASAHFGDSAGFGLFSIRERLRYLGGGMQIDSLPGSGARVSVWVACGPEG